MTFNEQFFRRAFELAEQGRNLCGINPFVGAVIVKEGRIIGEGYTQECGKNHAEIEALTNATESTEGAELYVTLEPCCHHGRTPPCTERIIRAGIKRVYGGITDPNPQVNGKGYAALKAAGIEVNKGFWADKIEKQLERYLTMRKKHRPFVIMKNAVSLDGKNATSNGDSRWITSPESREYVHQLRKEAGVVVTGINTIIKDDPLLNVRLGGESEPILRIILDSYLRIPLKSNIVETAATIPTIIYKREDYENSSKEKKLIGKKITIGSLTVESKNHLSLVELMRELNTLEIHTVMVEAGTELSSSFLRHNLVDKLYYFIAPKIIGGKNSVFNTLQIASLNESIRLKTDSITQIGDDLLVIGYPQYPEHSPQVII
jgi:diaminohydroxyphosphoribosylaminopyrimidine deaminase/5-amino-6-(5-phosphoribosylamino)uracil reductase